MKRYIALGPNLIVKMETGELKSGGGIIIAAEGNRETDREEGIIEQLGEDAFTDLLEANRPKVGDKVYFKRYEGTTVIKAKDADDQLERRVIQDTRILCRVED